MNKNCVPIASTKTVKRHQKQRQRKRTETTARPNLRFSPTAWAKLLFLRDYGETEVGGFGISSHDDLLLIEDIRLVQQICTWVHVAFDDTAVADFFDDQVDAGRQPEQFGRIWIHTHPGDCPLPSLTDDDTFERVFGCSQWAIMFILARGGQSFARLRFNIGPGLSINLPVSIDYTRAFDGCELAKWEQEYLANIQIFSPIREVIRSPSQFACASDQSPMNPWSEYWMGDGLVQDSPGEIIL